MKAIAADVAPSWITAASKHRRRRGFAVAGSVNRAALLLDPAHPRFQSGESGARFRELSVGRYAIRRHGGYVFGG